MKLTSLFSAIALVSGVTVTGVASADEAMQLSTAQMDNVAAGHYGRYDNNGAVGGFNEYWRHHHHHRHYGNKGAVGGEMDDYSKKCKNDNAVSPAEETATAPNAAAVAKSNIDVTVNVAVNNVNKAIAANF